MALTVSEVAKLAHVSVRTLHHYDELGLVRPSGRTESNYRLYDNADLLRLQQVLFFKELGFPLEEIRRLLDDPGFNVRDALATQRKLITQRQARLQTLLQAVEKAIEAHERGIAMTKEEMFEVFGDFDPTEHRAEAEKRWGDTGAYQESMKRTARYRKQDWIAIRNEAEAIYRRLVDHMEAGTLPTDPKVMALAEEHRQHLSKWFYECSKEIHRGLGDLYVSDPRFMANIDKAGAGLAAYLREAIIANAVQK
jgi:DNA-binding transcriptional MerR regulator